MAQGVKQKQHHGMWFRGEGFGRLRFQAAATTYHLCSQDPTYNSYIGASRNVEPNTYAIIPVMRNPHKGRYNL